MHKPVSKNIDRTLESLEYEAPFLIEKLLKEHIAETFDEAELLFREVKRYLALVQADAIAWNMFSLRVDEAWHQFVLFTLEYRNYCLKYFNHFVHHSPSNAPKSSAGSYGKSSSSFNSFRARYEEFYKSPLPDIWYDYKSIKPHRRVINYDAGKWTLREIDGMVDVLNANGIICLSVNAFANSAISFIACTGAFYVRELPGDLSDDEKIAIVASLVECKLLRVSS